MKIQFFGPSSGRVEVNGKLLIPARLLTPFYPQNRTLASWLKRELFYSENFRGGASNELVQKIIDWPVPSLEKITALARLVPQGRGECIIAEAITNNNNKLILLSNDAAFADRAETVLGQRVFSGTPVSPQREAYYIDIFNLD
ncbi:MAG: hypothetical protein HQ564_00680 [Candidatus Saganbacteria bacterium]|nr:hypothetical protein [Candidatus Saganbacteria bacterium]